jgi:hypothetical protein
LIYRFRGLLKSPLRAYVVIPAEAGIQSLKGYLDSRFRGSDGEWEFFRSLVEKISPGGIEK